MNSEEKCFLKKVIWKKVIPEPLLTIKTHKKVLANGHFNSRFIVPSDMFTARFCKVGFKAIKAILDKHGVVYDRHNIVQARSLVFRLEGLGLRRDSVTIASVDATWMYPSIKFCMIEKAVRYFIDACERFDEDDERVLEDALEMIQFGMANSLLVFDGEYYQYTAGEDEPEDRGLTIGGYHSAWLSDLTMAWGMEAVDPSVFTDTELFRFYRDDGIIVFNRKLNSLELKWWLQSFQAEFNELAKSDHLQFEMVVWNPDGECNLHPVRGAPITVDESHAFPFLDVEMSWTASDELRFDVHKKEEYHLQYIDEQSTHTSAMKASIHKGVLHRLATLTTMLPDNADQSLDTLYAEYAEAMGKAGVTPKRYPTMREAKELWESETPSERVIRKEQEKDRRSPRRQVYCKVGYSKFWSAPLHVKLKELRNKHGLKWLRLSMSYHVFPNLREMLGSDLREKLGCDVVSQNEVDRPCNCTEEHKIRRGKCIFGGKCLTKCSVYEATCLQCKEVYIGKSQPFLKERFRGHCNTVQVHCNEIQGAVGNRNVPRVIPAHTTLSSHM